MKCTPALSAIVVLGLAACETMTGPIASGDFDPLRPPGGNIVKLASASSSTFKAGQFVRAAINNTAFFKNRPKGDADADKLLTRGTSMKMISTIGSYAKIELDSGEIGFVPTVMLEDPSITSAAPALQAMQTTAPGQYQIYPPMPGGTGISEPLPALDPAGLPPEGAIPTVIDPEAAPLPLPAVTPTTDTFPTPAASLNPEPPIQPKVESIPLPPNGE